MLKNDKFFRMLGLAARMGGIAFGEGAVKDAIRKGAACLVVVASDASENTKKKFKNSCEFYSVSLVEYSDKITLGRYTGRSFAVVLAVMNRGIAEEISKCLGNISELAHCQQKGEEL